MTLTIASRCGSAFVTTRAGVSVLLFLLMSLPPLAAQADDLFDSQMQLAKQGNAEAQFRVGEMYEDGTGVDRNIREARYWFIRSANQKHEEAGFKLLYWDLDKKGLNDSNQESLNALNNEARRGNPLAQYYLGKLYANGVGINRNSDAAIEWLQKAASKGVLEAELELAAISERKPRDARGERRFESDPCIGKTAKFLSTCK